jgi:hypothetical protein
MVRKRLDNKSFDKQVLRRSVENLIVRPRAPAASLAVLAPLRHWQFPKGHCGPRQGLAHYHRSASDRFSIVPRSRACRSIAVLA